MKNKLIAGTLAALGLVLSGSAFAAAPKKVAQAATAKTTDGKAAADTTTSPTAKKIKKSHKAKKATKMGNTTAAPGSAATPDTTPAK